MTHYRCLSDRKRLSLRYSYASPLNFHKLSRLSISLCFQIRLNYVLVFYKHLHKRKNAIRHIFSGKHLKPERRLLARHPLQNLLAMPRPRLQIESRFFCQLLMSCRGPLHVTKPRPTCQPLFSGHKTNLFAFVISFVDTSRLLKLRHRVMNRSLPRKILKLNSTRKAKMKLDGNIKVPTPPTIKNA